jgi:3-deoxy-D-arabino-heptulosonate 7-phosphate (DAHP) synthase
MNSKITSLTMILQKQVKRMEQNRYYENKRTGELIDCEKILSAMENKEEIIIDTTDDESKELVKFVYIYSQLKKQVEETKKKIGDLLSSNTNQ